MTAPPLAGNTVIMRPAELSALAMAEGLARIVPPGVIQIRPGLGAEVGDVLVTHRDVRRPAFIGSVGTGLRIQATAAASGRVKAITRELGGKNALVVLADADLDLAVEGIAGGMDFTGHGRSCWSTSRLLVQRDVYDEVVARVGEKLADLRTGSALNSGNTSGALVCRAQLDGVLWYIDIGKSEGARLVTGGERFTEDALAEGNLLSPTRFADGGPAGRRATEEILGPVLAAMPFDDCDEALKIVNSVDHGPTALVYTRDPETALRFSRDIESSYVWVNESPCPFDGPPFDGYSNSGVGQNEDISDHESDTQVKTVDIRFSA